MAIEQTEKTELVELIENLHDASTLWANSHSQVVDEVQRLAGMGFSPAAIMRASDGRLSFRQVIDCLTGDGSEYRP